MRTVGAAVVIAALAGWLLLFATTLGGQVTSPASPAGERTPTPTRTATEPAGGSPSPTPTATPEATPTPVSYTVQSGDTLARIAQQFDVTVEALAEANNITDPSRLEIGQQLVIPQEE